MFTVLVRRLRARYPDAHISMNHNDAEGIATLDSNVIPIVVGTGRLCSIEMILREAYSWPNRGALWKAEMPCVLWRRTLLGAARGEQTRRLTSWTAWQTCYSNGRRLSLTVGAIYGCVC